MYNDFQHVQWPGWETVGLIGRGSFGAVFEIQRDVMGEVEKAAMKVITIPQNVGDIEEMVSEGADSESITSTFQNHLRSIVAEYSLMRKMSGSSNVVSCDDVRYVQHSDGIGWDIFIKMELLTPLIKVLPQSYSEETVVKIGKDMCSALMLCQKHGVIHRDIKPQNIFLSDNGDYKLGDFGVAKIVERTMGGTKIGTYKYMAPEVFNNQPYGSTVDIYSLGLVLYWLMNERRMPFLPLPPEKLNADLDKEARVRRFSGEKIPAPANGSEGLKRIILKACAFDPKDRYQTPREMWEDMDALRLVPAPQKKPKLLLWLIGGAAALLIGGGCLALALGGVFGGRAKIVEQPVAKPVTAGEELVVQLEAEGDDLDYQWMMAPAGSDEFVRVGRNSAKFSETAEMDMNGNRLKCVITDEKGREVSSDVIILEVVFPIQITKQPVSVEVRKGEQVVLSVEAEGDGLTYQWWYCEATETEFDKSSITEHVYSVEMIDGRNGRKLYCEITDADGYVIQTETVEITMLPSIIIKTQPKSVEVFRSELAVVTVEAEGEGLTYVWYYKNAGAKDFVKTDAFDGNTYSVEMNEDRDGRQLYCVITAKDGTVIKTDVVTISMTKPIQITSQPKSISVAKGEQAVVTVEAKGKNLTYEWYYKNVGAQDFIKTDAFTGNTYRVEMNKDRDGRQLFCKISDSDGNIIKTDTVTISMIPPIQISAQPKSVTVAKGEQAVVTVEAKGKNLTYEWYFKNAGAQDFIKTDAFTGNTYSVEMNQDRAGRQLYCLITDADGNQIKTVTVTINMK